MNSSLPLTLERTSFGFLLFSTAQPIDSDWVTLRRRMVFCLEFCLMIGWRQTAKTVTVLSVSVIAWKRRGKGCTFFSTPAISSNFHRICKLYRQEM